MSRAFQRAIAAKRTRIAAAWLVVAFGLASCDSGGETTTARPPEVVGTVALGELPPPLPPDVPSTPPRIDPTTTTTTEAPVTEVERPVGGFVDGDRVLVIGDGVLAATTPEVGGGLCSVLADELGWTVGYAVDSGRVVGWANQVLDARFDPATDDDWDVVIVLLGNVFDGDLAAIETELDTMLDRLESRPVIFFTLTELDNEAEVNGLLRERAELPSVLVIEWAELTAVETDLLRSGGPLPTQAGRERLVALMADELGPAPTGSTGDCLPSLLPDVNAARN